MKYKLIAILNLLLGLIELFVGLSFTFVVIPRMMVLYENMNVIISPWQKYRSSIIAIISSTLSIFLAFKILKTKGKNKEKYFLAGVIYLAVTFFLAAVNTWLTSLSIIGPIYNLSSQLQ